MKNKEAKSIFSSLENFSSTPPPELWDKIEAQLEEPKKKKRPVIWWWVAAGLVAGLSVPTLLYVNSNQGNVLELNVGNNANGVVLQNDSKDNLNDNKNENTIEKTSLDKNNSTTETKNETKNENLMVKENSISVTNTNSAVAKTTPVIQSKTKDSKIFQNSKREEHNQFIAEGNAKSQSDAIATNKNAKANSYNAASIIGTNNASLIGNSNGNTKTIASSENSTASESKQNKESIKSANPKLTVPNQNTDVSGFNNDKAIAENTASKDSLSIIKKEVTQLENALAELDKKDKDKKKTSPEVIDKWSLQVFAGVMSSENFNNEKALGNTVASKQSSGYGVKTNYKLNKKWAVSSGFKINELGQKIDGVAYYERSSTLNSPSGVLPITPGNVSLDISSNNNIVFASTNENYLFSSNSKTASGFETGNVTQNLRYFEMPVEISYAVLSKKKTNIIMNTGGFVGKLISNDILLNGNSIGENNNVNEFVYGTLLSSTLQYEFYKKTKFFIEPGMNYYINPLQNQSFNQFQWMFNVGLNVSF
jgi:hypothetical protein